MSMKSMSIDFESYILGDVGEVLTASMLRELGCQVLRNLYLPCDGKSTEIDMVALSVKGILCIENKNYSGVVTGGSSDLYWISGGVVFQNPVRQNSVHVNMLKQQLYGKYDRYVRNIVIFNDKVERLRLSGVAHKVFRCSCFPDFYWRLPDVLWKSDLLLIYKCLSKFSDQSLDARLRHVSAIKRGEKNDEVSKI